MRKLRTLVVFAALIGLPTSAWAGRRHTIRAGETLTHIAKAYGCTVSDLQAANRGAGDRIYPGTRLTIPDCGRAAAPKARAPARQARAAEPTRARTPTAKSPRVAAAVEASKPAPTRAKPVKPAAKPAAAPTPAPKPVQEAKPARSPARPSTAAPVELPTVELTPAPIARPDEVDADREPTPKIGMRDEVNDNLDDDLDDDGEPTDTGREPAPTPREPASSTPLRIATATVPTPTYDAAFLARTNEDYEDEDLSDRPAVDVHLPANATLPDAGDGHSIGQPWHGRLQAGVQLQAGKGYLLRRPHRAWGAPHVTAHVQGILRSMHRQFPRAHDLAVGDLSAPEGGRISEHRSHQSGRDLDIGFYYKEAPKGYPASFVTKTNELDLGKTWTLIQAFLSTQGKPGGVTAIYLDHAVQKRIYEWALKRDVPRSYLDKVFEYPHGRGSKLGIIRHQRNHADHLHVRFACAPSDASCHE